MHEYEEQTSVERPVLAVTLGDPNGIGPEIALGAALSLRAECRSLLVGSASVLQQHARKLELELPELRVVDRVPDRWPEEELVVWDISGEDEVEVTWGETTEIGGRIAMRAVERATTLCLEERAGGMVTAPISKEAIQMAGYAFPGHTEYLAERSRTDRYLMMMVAGGLRVAVVTAHVPLREVVRHVTEEAVLEKLRSLDESLKADFGIERPRIAVLGLNPHAGDGGVLGREEIEIIDPALERAREEGIDALGPYPADAYFGIDPERHDAVLATYHDQGLVPFKALAFDRGVNFTAGLPIVRTSPDHGTAFDIAGEGKAHPGSMEAAMRLAARLARRRSLATD